MIIWIDGTYGVGKTTVAKQLKKKWGSETELLEADEYINETIKRLLKKQKRLIQRQILVEIYHRII